MRTHVVRAAAWALVALALAAPAQLAAAQEMDLSKAPRITVAELKKLQAEGPVMIVDVRDHAAFRSGHIPGAVSIPLDQVASRVAEFKAAKKPIIIYCA